jgi:hypothetical protein
VVDEREREWDEPGEGDEGGDGGEEPEVHQ